MRRQSLRMQTTVIIIMAFLISHVAGYIIYTLDRRDALEMTEAIDVAERAAGISRLTRDLPASWQGEIVQFSDSRAFRVWTSAQSAVETANATEAELDLLSYLRSQVPRIDDHEMRVKLLENNDELGRLPYFDKVGRSGSSATAMDALIAGPRLAISIQHSDAEWVNFLGAINTPKSLLPELLLINLLSAGLVISLVAFWVVGRVTRPLAEFADAAEGLGLNLSRDPISVHGPREVAVAAAALNRMQRQLIRLLQGRTELLATISHDLRTPLTQLRLRLELMPKSNERMKLLQTIDDMDSTIGTFLAFARAAHDSEPVSRIDIGTLVSSICDDLADNGASITYNSAPDIIVSCKRLSIKRAIVNFIDNALKYGDTAHVFVRHSDVGIVISIEDFGPGIPEAEIQMVLKPFFRGKLTQNGARKPGTGLGLSIAQAILEDQGCALRLSNRLEGGLRAEIFLPAHGKGSV